MNHAPFPPDLLQSPKWAWHIPSPEVAAEVRAFTLSDDCLVKSTAVRAVYRCGGYHLKFERAPGLLGRFRNRLRPKARNEFAVGQALAESGVPSVECVGWGQLGGTNVLITRTLPGAVSLEEYFYTHVVEGGESPDGILAEITAFLNKFFDAGFYHGDLHFGNILYRPDTHTLAFVDLIAIARREALGEDERRAMCRCVVTLRNGLDRARMLKAIRDVGAAFGESEAEAFYFDVLRGTARHLVETWDKRRSQILGGYPKFTDALPCPDDPARTILLRKDWLSRPIFAKEDAAKGLPPGYERMNPPPREREQDDGDESVEPENMAETMFLRSMYLQTLRVKHRRIVAFVQPGELWMEPLPAGLSPEPPSPDDPEFAFFRKTLDELMIEAPPETIRRLPDGAFYLTCVDRVYTGIEA